MLTNFEMNEAKSLREAINQSLFDFVLNPEIARDLDRLEILEKKCSHKYENNVCVYCGKEQN